MYSTKVLCITKPKQNLTHANIKLIYFCGRINFIYIEAETFFNKMKLIKMLKIKYKQMTIVNESISCYKKSVEKYYMLKIQNLE